MRFAVWPGNQQPWDDLLDVVRHAESSGWDRAYVADHFMSNDAAKGPMLECMATLTALGALVPRIELGTLVCGNTYRHPAVLANQAAAADVVSGGRVVLGLGAGWQENEHEAYGIPLPPLKERMDRFEEACAIVRGLTTEDRLTFPGQHYQLTDAPMDPKPVGPLPLLVGGGGEKRTIPIAARYAQEWNVWGSPEVFAHKSGVLDRACVDVDRDPATIRRSTQALLFLVDDEGTQAKVRDSVGTERAVIGNAEQVTETMLAYGEAGVDEFIVPDFTLGVGAKRAEILDRFQAEVVPNVS